MTSDQKIAANRNNAKKSTGPRTAAGRATSRLNARRHGLATGIRADPAIRDDIEKLAGIFARASRRDKIGEFDLEAAEAHLDLLRIRRFRVALVKGCGLRGDASRENLMALGEQLSKIERYERRAFSRRMRALRLI
jgi:hypothetical protein